MEGNPRYTFEFAMPPSDNLYVEVRGEEQDTLNLDDSLGQTMHQYTPYQNWGARPEAYRAQSGGTPPYVMMRPACRARTG